MKVPDLIVRIDLAEAELRFFSHLLKEKEMIDKAREQLVGDAFEMVTSLNDSVRKAGGVPFTVERLKETSMLAGITHLATNGIRFHYTNDHVKSNVLNNIKHSLDAIRTHYTDPDWTDRQRRAEIDRLIKYVAEQGSKNA